jgi:hypothetical protein
MSGAAMTRLLNCALMFLRRKRSNAVENTLLSVNARSSPLDTLSK